MGIGFFLLRQKKYILALSVYLTILPLKMPIFSLAILSNVDYLFIDVKNMLHMCNECFFTFFFENLYRKLYLIGVKCVIM